MTPSMRRELKRAQAEKARTEREARIADLEEELL